MPDSEMVFMVDEKCDYSDQLVQLARLALKGSLEDVRLYVAQLVRKNRSVDPILSESLNKLLKNKPENSRNVLREDSRDTNLAYSRSSNSSISNVPAFLRGPLEGFEAKQPLLTPILENQLNDIVCENKQVEKLRQAGLSPSNSMIFVGSPGVGKTLTAHWLSEKLELPLYVLDLATVMSSFLGQTGANFKIALTYAKERPCVLLLDEIDALAKKRSDDLDIGEAKRLVTVLLQEIEQWSEKSILIAATNHAELVDPALWRRFDHVFQFELPSEELVEKAIQMFLGPDFEVFKPFIPILQLLFKGQSYSDIERQVLRLRRSFIMGTDSSKEALGLFLQNEMKDKKKRHELAKVLTQSGQWSQHRISELTGVSRDTLRRFRISAKGKEDD